MSLLISNLLVALPAVLAATEPPGLVSSEFVFERGPTTGCHASTIVETTDGQLLTAWFGGTREAHPDVCIYLSRWRGTHWGEPQQVADGVQLSGKRYPCWNPVLFQPKHGPLMLFYKVGPEPMRWWGMLRTSTDGGQTWGEARRLPDGILGPIKNKPVELPNGDILCGSSVESQVWTVHFERSRDGGKTWTATKRVNDGKTINAIQPSLLTYPGGRLQAVGRTTNKQVFSTWSNDGGQTWGPLKLLPLPNPNAGTDAVSLADGRQLLVYNHNPAGRSPLCVAVSSDGEQWQTVLRLEDTPHYEFSYPAVIQTRDGLVHITYTWKRQRIKHVVLEPARLDTRPPTRSPLTNAVEWRDGHPIGLPGFKRPHVESAWLYRPTSEWTYSHHASLTWFRDRFVASWSNGHRDEDAAGQRVLVSTSTDFAHWSEPSVLCPSEVDAIGRGRVLTAGGFHQHDGTLVAYCGNYGTDKEGTRLEAVTTTDGRHWTPKRDLGLPVCPNHGPQPTASGRLLLSGNTSFAWTDDPSGLAGWQLAGIYPTSLAQGYKDDPASFWDVANWQGWWPAALCEGSFFQTPDNVLHLLLRNAGGKYNTQRLFASESRDDGRTWSTPRESEFSDTNAKFHFGRLPDGRYYYVGNPIGADRTPLVLSLSTDGVRFDRHFVLGEQHYESARTGRWKGGEYGYPHTLVHDGWLYVIVSRQKEAVQVLRVKLADLA